LVIGFDYYRSSTASELTRRLAKVGCSFEEGKKHTKVILGGKFTFIPRHPSKEIKSGTLRSILRKLNIGL
jgi:mRNA interferase HicA